MNLKVSILSARCLAYVAGFVVLTLIINATTLELLIKMLGLGQPTAAELKVMSPEPSTIKGKPQTMKPSPMRLYVEQYTSRTTLQNPP